MVNEADGGVTRPGKGGHRKSLFNGVSQICDVAVRLTNSDGAAIALLTRSGGVRDLVYATDTVSQQLDELQFTLGEGPCLDSFINNAPAIWDDIADDGQLTQWPIFGIEALALGAHALFAFPVGDDEAAPLGILELYRRTPGPLLAAEQASATMCAHAAAVTVRHNWGAYSEDNDVDGTHDIAFDLAEDDLADTSQFSRAGVYLASGMVAVQLSISPDDALDRLRAMSFQQGRPISEVAAEIVNRTVSLTDEDLR